MCRLIRQSRLDKSAGFGEEGFRISRVLRSREATSKTRRSRHILQKSEAILQNVRRYAMFLRPKGVKIWEKEKEYPLKIFYTLFLESHIGC